MMRPVRGWDVAQSMRLPPSVHELFPADHVAHFIRGTVIDEIDLSAVWHAYHGFRGGAGASRGDDCRAAASVLPQGIYA